MGAARQRAATSSASQPQAQAQAELALSQIKTEVTNWPLMVAWGFLQWAANLPTGAAAADLFACRSDCDERQRQMCSLQQQVKSTINPWR